MAQIVCQQGEKLELSGKSFKLAINPQNEDFWKLGFSEEGIMVQHQNSQKDLHLVVVDYLTLTFSIKGKMFRMLFRLGLKASISSELEGFKSFCVGILNSDRVQLFLSNQSNIEMKTDEDEEEALDFFRLYLSSDEGDLLVSYNPQIGGKYAREFVVLYTDDRKVCRLLKHLSREVLF